MRTLVALLGVIAVAVMVPLSASAKPGHGHNHGKCGKHGARAEPGYQVIFDGSRACFARWRYAGGSTIALQRDGTLRSGPGAPNLGVLWYAARPYGDFSLRLQFRDDAPAGQRANSGIQVRFPAPRPPVPGCPMTFNGQPQTTNGAAWIAVNCGHEVQINDSPDGGTNDPRKTGSIYGFADLNSAQSRPTPAGTWNDLEIKVVGQHYTVVRNGTVINEYENVPGVPFPGRPNDPGSDSRGLVGYIGLQAHGGPNDTVSFRNIRILDLSDQD
jgi:3-keto-disaccharide hydrolase